MLYNFQTMHNFCAVQFSRLDTADTLPKLSRAREIKLISGSFKHWKAKTLIILKGREAQNLQFVPLILPGEGSIDVPRFLSSADTSESQFVSWDFAVRTENEMLPPFAGRGSMNSFSKFGFVYFYLAFYIMILLSIPADIFAVEVLLQCHSTSC